MSALTATLGFSSPLSGSAAPRAAALAGGHCAAASIAFRRSLGRQRNALPSGRLLSQRLPGPSPEANPRPATLSSRPSLLPYLYISLHIGSDEDRYVWTERLGFFSPGQRLLLHSFGQVLLLYFIPRPAPPRPRLLWRSLSLLSFSLPLLTPPEACVTALPISGFEPQRLPKPPDCPRQIFRPGRREGSRGELALYPSPSLHSLHLAFDQVFLPTGFIERTQRVSRGKKRTELQETS